MHIYYDHLAFRSKKGIMEVKLPEECPTWLLQTFNKHGITQTSFSKPTA